MKKLAKKLLCLTAVLALTLSLSLGYLSTDSVTKLAECGEGFCTGCFTGEYPVEVPEKKAKFRFERGLSEKE